MSNNVLKSYSGVKSSQISFPIGGIGSGCIGLSGEGRLIDWEIFNKPNKFGKNGFTHFAVKAVSKGKLLDARILCGELPPNYMGQFRPKSYSGFGFGPDRETMAGLPNFLKSSFSAENPFAKVELSDPSFPGKVTLTAFNPFIPLNEDDSSIPAAFFEIEFENKSSESIDYSAAFTVRNPSGKAINKASSKGGLHLIHLTDKKNESDTPEYGDLCVACDAKDVSVQEYWFRGRWFDNLEVFWRDFASVKPLPERNYPVEGDGDHATLMATLKLKPKSQGALRFALSWNYPNCVNYWNKPQSACNCDGACDAKPKTWKNYYATLFKDSTESASYAIKNWKRLKEESGRFSDALHSSSMPPEAMELVSANLSILKSPTVLRLEDGSFYAWEGCHCDSGCCEGSCTHVWNYAYALPFLFPKLERSMRELNWKYNMRDDGGLVFRIKLPLGSDRGGFRPCADGQFGDIVKVYREWKISGDTAWMKKLWPDVKKSIEFAWASTNEDKWDPKKSGVLTGRQHHTLDMELFGPNAWLTGMYLAALKAGAEMAEAAGEPASAKEYGEIFERGRKWVDENLFNGKWYSQKLDLGDKSQLDKFGDASEVYWNGEHKEIKYQIGEGSSIDQLLGQWHANLCGLGDIFDKAKRKKAAKSIYKHNFKRSFRNYFNPCRLYSLYDEAGVTICDCPEGVRKPVVPAPYNSETMYGFEYSAAALMIQEGLVKEGLEIVEKGRLRFDGERRNPWNEFECGSNYARSMASYSLLNALSGFEFDATKDMIGFSPCTDETSFSAFWSLDSGWGTVEFAKGRISINVLYGSLAIAEFRSRRIAKAKSARLDGKELPFASDKGRLEFKKTATVKAGKTLEIKL